MHEISTDWLYYYVFVQEQWLLVFPNIVSIAKVVGVLSSTRVEGNYDGTLQVVIKMALICGNRVLFHLNVKSCILYFHQTKFSPQTIIVILRLLVSRKNLKELATIFISTHICIIHWRTHSHAY